MNDQLTHEMLMHLVKAEAPCSISLYMRTHRIGNEAEQDPIRLRNLLDGLEDELRETGMDPQSTAQRLAGLRKLQDDRQFWQHQSDGLAIFLSSNDEHVLRLPLQFDELAVIAPRFHVKPLIPLVTGNGCFYVLALSQNDVRLFTASRDGMQEMELRYVPTSLADALWHDDEEPQLQYHTGTGAQGDGRRAALFHGQGIGSDDKKETLRRFLRQVDRGVLELIDEARAPLVIAGVDYVAAIYREISNYPELVPEPVTGNPDNESEQELHAAAWAVVEPDFRAALESARARYHTLAAQDLAASDLATVAQGAHLGRVDVAFTVVDKQVWGRFDPQSNTMELDAQGTPQNEDLIDLIARATLAHGGTVYALERDEMPDGENVAALFRW